MKRLFTAATRRDPEKVKQCLDWETSDPARALLEYAAIGDLEKVRDLLRAGVDPNAEVMVDVSVDLVKDTPLLAAAGGGHVNVAGALIAGGALVDKRDDDDYTPLIRAAADGWPRMVEFLHGQGADINARENIFNHTALHKATRLGNVRTAEALIALGADQTLCDSSVKTAEQTICDQYGGVGEEKETRTAEIQQAFDNDRAQKTAVEAARVQAIANAAILQNDLTISAPPQIIHRRAPKGPRP